MSSKTLILIVSYAMQLALLLPSLTAPYVPLLTFGIVSLIGSILAIALPETAGHHLPDSFAEVKFQGYVSNPKYLRHLKSIQANFAGGVLGERSTLLELEYVLMACFQTRLIRNLKNTFSSSAFGGIHYLCLSTLTQE